MLKKIAIVLSAATIVNFASQPLKAVASQVADSKLPVTLQSNVQEGDKTIVNTFSLYGKSELNEYNKLFKMDTSNIETISNNGGKYGSSDINKAIDGKLDTHWETGKPNSGSFTNEVNIKLKEATTLNRIVYATRQDGAKGKGFPNEFEIYASKTDGGNDFDLVSKGSHTTTGDLIEIQFKPTEFKRIKFVFKKSNQNWASASEFWFYKEDKLADTIDKLFTDNLKTDLSNEYKSKEKIDELARLAENHPLKSQYQTSIDQAKGLIENPALSDQYKKGVITLEQLGFSNTDAWTNKGQCFQLSNLLPTGLYYTPGEQFVIDVEAENGKLPTLVFDQNYDSKSSNEQKTFTLKPGRNIITAPKNVNGGGVFFENNYLPSEQKVAPKISIKSGGNPYPIFYDGVTNVNEFKETLKNYKQKMSESNKNGKIIVPNLVTIVTEHSMVFGLATDAYKAYVEKNGNPQATANAWENLLLSDYEMLGYTKDAENIKDRIPTNRLLARAVKSGLYAAGGYIGIEYTSNLLNSTFGWAIYHETGHVVELSKLRFLEMTNNLFSLMNQEKAGQSIRVETNANFTELWDKYTSGKTLGFGYQSRPDAEVKIGGWAAHLELWQLRIAFGEKVFTDIFKLARNTPAINGANTSDNWARFASEATGYDLGEYLYRMGLNVHKETLDYTSKFKKLDKAIQYADTNARVYKGNGFASGYVSKIQSVKRGTDQVTITADTEGVKDDFMGFEVYRNNKLIGYTNKTSFVDKNFKTEESGNLEYKIVAYDRKLNAAKQSASSKIDATSPVLNVDAKSYYPVGYEFNPLDNVKAVDPAGNDISQNIKILENNVDTSKVGEYTVKYKVEDSNGKSVEKTREVVIVSESINVSDVDWKSGKTGWGSIQKNKSVENNLIRLLDSNNKAVEYNSGIGTHANSTIIYDLKDKGYKAFSSYIGVDQEMGKSGVSSITFEVYVDGKKVYDSGVMKSNTPQKYVAASLEGASELKLVVTDAKNGNGSDHADWANAKFYLESKKQDSHTVALNKLKELVKYADTITDISFVGAKDHKEERWYNFTTVRENARKALENTNTTEKQINIQLAVLQNYIEELEMK